MEMVMEKKVKRAFAMQGETMSLAELATSFSQVLQINASVRGKEKFLEGLKHYGAGSLDMGIQTLGEARILQYNPAQKMKQIKALREAATELFFGGRLSEARDKIMECMTLVKEADELQSKCLESKLRLQLSLIAHKMGDITQALVEINHSLALDGLYVNGLLHRAYLYRRSRMFDEAIHDLKEAQKLDSANDRYGEWIQEAENAAKRHHHGF